MNKEQIEYELKRKEADLAWWTEHKQTISANDEGGMVGVCDLQINHARERIGDLQDRVALLGFQESEDIDYGYHAQHDM